MKLLGNHINTILNSISDFVLVISPDKEIMEVNDSFLQCLSYTRESVIGRKCYHVFKEATRKSSNCHHVCPLEAVIRNKRAFSTELTRLGGDGQPRFTELTIIPIWGAKGEIHRFVEISRDITKRKNDEREITRRLERMVAERTRQLKETHEKLLHQDKMASLGKLASSVVHEINNPIAGIITLTTLSKRILGDGCVRTEDLEQFEHYLDLMGAELRRISRIIGNLLVFSRQSAVELRPLDVNQLIEQMLLLNANLVKLNGICVEKNLDPDLPRIIGSSDQLQQVFMNLVSNAVESMAAKGSGTLTVTTGTNDTGDTVIIRFIDTGVGISPEDIPKIFEPFYTTKKKGKGVGLGLSVIYGIIKDHGGVIYVDSKPGKGSQFRITLPLKPPADKS